MSEENKALKSAIEELKCIAEGYVPPELAIVEAEALLGFIDKQQKEIEELKLQVQCDKTQRLEYQKILVQDFVDKYKIREKIKDLEENMILFTNDKEKFNRYKYARDILEKLLEEK